MGFGATGEFVRDADEPADVRRDDSGIEIMTARGAIRVEARPLMAAAWDSLSSDGETWGHTLAFCAERIPSGARVVTALGPDRAALRAPDRSAMMFDLGVGAGCIRMCARTADAAGDETGCQTAAGVAESLLRGE